MGQDYARLHKITTYSFSNIKDQIDCIETKGHSVKMKLIEIQDHTFKAIDVNMTVHEN